MNTPAPRKCSTLVTAQYQKNGDLHLIKKKTKGNIHSLKIHGCFEISRHYVVYIKSHQSCSLTQICLIAESVFLMMLHNDYKKQEGAISPLSSFSQGCCMGQTAAQGGEELWAVAGVVISTVLSVPLGGDIFHAIGIIVVKCCQWCSMLGLYWPMRGSCYIFRNL